MVYLRANPRCFSLVILLLYACCVHCAPVLKDSSTNLSKSQGSLHQIKDSDRHFEQASPSISQSSIHSKYGRSDSQANHQQEDDSDHYHSDAINTSAPSSPRQHSSPDYSAQRDLLHPLRYASEDQIISASYGLHYRDRLAREAEAQHREEQDRNFTTLLEELAAARRLTQEHDMEREMQHQATRRNRSWFHRLKNRNRVSSHRVSEKK